MLRHTRFVDSLISRSGKGSALPHFHIRLSSGDRKTAFIEARKANSYLKSLSPQEFRGLKPSDLNKAIFLNKCVGNYEEVLSIAKRMAYEPPEQQYLSAELYLLLLQLILALKDISKIALAMQLCRELSSMANDKEVKEAFKLVLQCASKSDDFTQLLPLRILFESLLPRLTEDHFEFRYLGTVSSILLNSNQYTSAVEQFNLSLKSFPSSDQRKKIYSNFPIVQFIEAMCDAQDCLNLISLLRGASKDPKILSHHLWLKCLSLGLHLNDYALVKLIYDVVITTKIDGQITIDDVIFDNKLDRLEEQNEIFGSFSNSTVSEILHTFASHGDVTLCLSLIELHFVHKTLKGQKGLSKEICIDIVRSYCYHESKESAIEQGEKDESVKQVIDVMHNFLTMQNVQITYKDVSDAFLQKLYNYRVFDKNVEDSTLKENIILQRIQDSTEDETILPRKLLSAQVSKSKQGNVFMNMDILGKFVIDHAMYILNSGYGKRTMSLFLNCVLDYVQKYQNFSGIITVFEAIHEVNKQSLSEWLDADLFDLLSRCLANSPAAMAPGFKLFLYLKSTEYEFTSKIVENYIFSALRNFENTLLLEFYVYEYLTLMNGSCCSLLKERLSNAILKNAEISQIANFLENLETYDDWREVWTLKMFVTRASQVLPEQIINSRYSEIDLRDLARLNKVLQ